MVEHQPAMRVTHERRRKQREHHERERERVQSQITHCELNIVRTSTKNEPTTSAIPMTIHMIWKMKKWNEIAERMTRLAASKIPTGIKSANIASGVRTLIFGSLPD